MTRMRTRIAERLMQSKNSIAMLTSFNEVNLTARPMATCARRMQEAVREAPRHQARLHEFLRQGVRPMALKRHPIVNCVGRRQRHHLPRLLADISIAVGDRQGPGRRRCCATPSTCPSPTSRRPSTATPKARATAS
jgi:2-oxoglutarate dehydrogenase E2 component (dihydrolipoamide succinyltransferase)